MPLEKAYILEEIKRTAAENGGRPLGRQRFAAATGIGPYDWGRYWVRFGDAVADAGFAPNRLRSAFSEPFLLEKLAHFTRELGRFPTYAELQHRSVNDGSFPVPKVFQKRFGRKREILAKLVRFCEESEAFGDVVALCGPLPAEPPPEAPSREAEVAFGSVYLLKSGRYYKIGRTNAVGRRERELAIQLPEPAKVVHEIKTDDPPGIESYWHRRFEDQRRGGEWFELAPADVAAFKRRRFM